MCAAALAPEHYINRELSWIAFNERVLAQALDPRTPLLDQAKFSAIFIKSIRHSRLLFIFRVIPKVINIIFLFKIYINQPCISFFN